MHVKINTILGETANGGETIAEAAQCECGSRRCFDIFFLVLAWFLYSSSLMVMRYGSACSSERTWELIIDPKIMDLEGTCREQLPEHFLS